MWIACFFLYISEFEKLDSQLDNQQTPNVFEITIS